jgi:hypothetical protein
MDAETAGKSQRATKAKRRIILRFEELGFGFPPEARVIE